MDSKLYSKCKIMWEVNDLILNGEDEHWRETFGEWAWRNDVGIPIAISVAYDCVDTLTEVGVKSVNEAWLDLCRIVMVDSDAEYEFFEDMVTIGAISE